MTWDGSDISFLVKNTLKKGAWNSWTSHTGIQCFEPVLHYSRDVLAMLSETNLLLVIYFFFQDEIVVSVCCPLCIVLWSDLEKYREWFSGHICNIAFSSCFIRNNPFKNHDSSIHERTPPSPALFSIAVRDILRHDLGPFSSSFFFIGRDVLLTTVLGSNLPSFEDGHCFIWRKRSHTQSSSLSTIV